MEPRNGKNIVICLDGTGDQFREENTNVVKLFRILARHPQEQVAYYNPGVGTLGDPSLVRSWWLKLKIKYSLARSAAFGRGLTQILQQAYAYLMDQYEEGDRVFIFGFSRGAYTARGLAGFIHACGLLDKGCQNLIPYAMKLYKAPRIDFKILAKFRSTYGRPCPIHFLGLWDSVSSFGWIFDPVFLPYTRNNKSVQAVRHALAIDEKRVFFSPLHWGDERQDGQDVKEVWFAGVHADIGGGYPEQESGLAKITLEWMIQEACQEKFGLKINTQKYQRYVLGSDNDNAYIGPDETVEAHESLKGLWWWVQYLPRRVWNYQSKRKQILFPPRIRPIAIGSSLHQSVLNRIKSANYQPVNLPRLKQAEFRQQFIIEGEK
jgi:uncharacterized protein (DUF2235 family)